MKRMIQMAMLFALAGVPEPAWAQRRRSEEEFVKDRPTIGDLLPDLTVYDAEGREVKTSGFRGHYTVLTFGCLT